ncbi:hypothetical protein RhiJN_13976 [Ceratobasidium sp. AG-Ba]|nr:hypothetical protein RhiJN_13976 [Ceratobasidium sp. AG-Ba]QRW14532.1 hypothetical protein RhiLY_13531 [Ceratobasidium sp. AG-Ba]
MSNASHIAFLLPTRYQSAPPTSHPSEHIASVNPGVHSIQLVDLMLGAHGRVTEREVEFTIAMLGAVTFVSNFLYHPIPSKFARRALQTPDLIRALADSPDMRIDVSELDDGMAFECMVKRLVFQFCYGACALTAEAYALAVEYLETRPDELFVKHEHYLVAHKLFREEQRAAKKVEERRLKKEKAAASIRLKMFSRTPKKSRKGPIVIRRLD